VTPGIRSDSTTRTNVGCANVGADGYSLRGDVHSADGSYLGSLWLSVPPLGWVQKLVPFPVSDGYVLWSRSWYLPTQGTPSGVTCFAVAVDNSTGDGSFLQ
jgi:hypothetical protein